MRSLELWVKGLLAAAIAGAAHGVITGIAAVGIDPEHFNLQAGIRPTLSIAGMSALGPLKTQIGAVPVLCLLNAY